MSTLARLVDHGDLDELARHADRLAFDSAWDELDELRQLCRRAVERGRQLWAVAARSEYRLALDAPGPWAARVLTEGAGRFAPGPLAEVAASSHEWAELAPHVDAGRPEPAVAAHERVVRGEDLRGDGRVMPGVLDVPLALEPWEPAYPVAVYEPDRATFPLGPVVDRAAVALPAPGRPVDDAAAVRALVELAAAWVADSNGRAEAVAVEAPSALAAIAALGVRGQCLVAEVPGAVAMAHMAWTAASGGAHGRRRGMAAGRFGAWWAAAALAGLSDAWPPDGGELGDAVADLRWFVWSPAGEAGAGIGWSLRLAVADPAEGLAWALTATDAALA